VPDDQGEYVTRRLAGSLKGGGGEGDRVTKGSFNVWLIRPHRTERKGGNSKWGGTARKRS